MLRILCGVIPIVVSSEFLHKRGQIRPCEFPVKRFSNRFISALKSQQTIFHSIKRVEMIGCEDLALNDREVNFDLVEPTGMNRQMDGKHVRPSLLQPLDTAISAMGRGIIDDEKDPFGILIRCLVHNLCQEPIEGCNARFGLTSSKQFSAMHIPSCKISQRTFAFIFVLDKDGMVSCWGYGFGPAMSGLNTGLFISRKHIFIRFKGLSLLNAVIQIQHTSRLLLEIGIAWKNPHPMAPRPNSVFIKPTPHRREADPFRQAMLQYLPFKEPLKGLSCNLAGTISS